jgi:Holliday junction resolvase RusA-like endonuclease
METRFRVNFTPTSVNKMYAINYHTKTMYLTEEARHYKMAIKIACPKVEFSSPQPRITVGLWYHSPKWICKNGKFKKKDIQNCDKLIFDAISERLGIDDSHVFKYSGEKVVDLEEYTEIEIGEII